MSKYIEVHIIIITRSFRIVMFSKQTYVSVYIALIIHFNIMRYNIILSVY